MLSPRSYRIAVPLDYESEETESLLVLAHTIVHFTYVIRVRDKFYVVAWYS